MKLNNKWTNILAACLLTFMLLLAFFSMRNDSATMDELAHTPAGYSYIVKQDMRLNPEHPPLLKDLAGLSVWFGSKITNEPINFPDQHKSWQEYINGQWDFGANLFYKSGNNADKIIFWGRLPMLLIMLILGFYVFRWARELYGNKAGLIALFLYSFSPTFLAHGRYVTTDVGAAAAFFIAIYYLVKWIQQQNKKNLIAAGIVFGLALLVKFSLILLVPYLVFLIFAWLIVNFSKQALCKTIIGFILIGIISLALIWPVYQFHTWNYPPEKQFADTDVILESFGNRLLADPVVWASDKPILRPYAQFFLGLLMVMQRAVGGNTTYFLGEISNIGWYNYFPIVFLIKVPLALFVLVLISLFISCYKVKKPFWHKTYQRFYQWLKIHFAEFALFSFLVIYWIVTLRSNLNIGVRHILPTFPVIYILISGQIAKCQISRGLPLKSCLSTALRLLLITLFLWYASAAIKIYPHFLTYFNGIVGGPTQGYKYVVDSNLDWGQDLKRLAQFVDENNIDKIYVDYFGGSSTEYYLKEKYQSWWGDRNPTDLPPNSWLAVSSTLLQAGRGAPAIGFKEKTGYYNWLNQYEPVKVIGNSIFVYFIK